MTRVSSFIYGYTLHCASAMRVTCRCSKLKFFNHVSVGELMNFSGKLYNRPLYVCKMYMYVSGTHWLQSGMTG